MDDDLEGVKFNIRACIISSKGPVPLRSLMRDYQTLVGSPIPYQRLEYPTLESFLQSLPSLRVIGSGRDLMVEAAADSASSHITNLIAKQKPAKKKDNYYSVPRRGHPPSRQSSDRGRNYSPRNSVPPRFHYRNNKEEPGGSLMVKLDGNDRRQVTMADTANKPSSSSSKQQIRPKQYNVPPRFQKTDQSGQVPQKRPMSTGEMTKKFDDTLYLERINKVGNENKSTSNSIISPLGPSQLIAAGRAKQQAEITHIEEFLLQPSESEHQINFAPTEMSQQYLNIQLEENLPVDAASNFVQFNHLNPLEDLKQPLVLTDASFPSDPPLLPEPDQKNIQNNVDILEQYAAARELVVEYTVFKRKPKGAFCTQYGTTVKLLNLGVIIKKCASYPHESENENVAKGYAAKRALEEIVEEEKVKFDKNIISSDVKTIHNRISEIITGMYAGIFANKVEELYSKKYLEHLPDDWIQTLHTCPTLSVENSLNNTIIVPKDLSLDLVINTPPVVPASIALESLPNDMWNVFITHAVSTCAVWCRIIDENYSDKYEDLLTEMGAYYSAKANEELALNIEVGQYYAAKSVDSWFRVCVCEVKQEAKTVTAWLVDHGDNDTFTFNSLHRLPEYFCSLPRQAIKIALEGLESFSEDSYACEVVSNSELLIGKVLVAVIKHKSEETGCVKVTLYDTADTEEGVNVNDKIQDSILYADPQLPIEGCAMEVNITNVSKRGEVYLQVDPEFSDGVISQMLKTLGQEEITKHKLTSYRQVVTNKIYLAKYSNDEEWYRAVVTATPSMQQNKIAIRFIDYGNADTVSISDIADVQNLPEMISKLPPQAVKVALHNLPVETLTNMEIAKLHSLLLSEDKIVLIKTVDLQENPPVVEIFYKSDNDGALVSVNSTIGMQRILYRPKDKTSGFDVINFQTNLDSRSNGNGAFSESLKRPSLNDEFLGVVVQLAANPGNFIFQPIKYKKELDSMMAQLQAYYDETALPEVSKEEVIKGRLFAARNTDDDTWYRVVVTEAIIGSKVPVRLCDFGDMVCLPLANFRELEVDFCELPFMGVKGKLAGVVPIHTDWSVEDCIRFQTMVVNKPLASLVIEIEDNFVDPMEMVVSLHLVNKEASSNEIVISEVLIKENRAVKEKA